MRELSDSRTSGRMHIVESFSAGLHFTSSSEVSLIRRSFIDAVVD